MTDDASFTSFYWSAQFSAAALIVRHHDRRWPGRCRRLRPDAAALGDAGRVGRTGHDFRLMPIGRIAALAAAVVVACGACGGGGGAASDDVAEIPGVGVTRMDVPRPTGAASAPCDEDPLPPARDQPIVERVADLRAVGLFADRAGVADAVLADEIEADLEATWSQPTTDGP